MKLSDAKILLADDEPLILDLFSDWLTERDSPPLVSTATDGELALEMILESPYDVLVTDINMPRMDGITLVRRLAVLGRTLPAIVMISGCANVDEREMYGMGVEAFIAKPFRRETLIRAVECALAERASLWKERLDTLPRQSISIEASDGMDDTKAGDIIMGRGGFSVYYPYPAAPGKVSFQCRFSPSGRQMTGQGFIRWRSKDQGTIGIEIAFLEESCRAATAERIKDHNPTAFIPAQ